MEFLSGAPRCNGVVFWGFWVGLVWVGPVGLGVRFLRPWVWSLGDVGRRVCPNPNHGFRDPVYVRMLFDMCVGVYVFV